MNPIDRDRGRTGLPISGGVDGVVLRSEAGLLFEAALRRAPDDGGSGAGGDDDRDRPARRLRFALGQPEPGLPASFVGLFQQSITQGLPAAANDASVLSALTRQVAEGVQAGRRVPGDRWRLMVRLQADVLPATALEVAGVDDQLIVTLRTADVATHAKLMQVLPQLGRGLVERGFHGLEVSVFLVGAEALP